MPDWSPHTALGVITEEYYDVLNTTRTTPSVSLCKEYLDLANAALLAYVALRVNMP